MNRAERLYDPISLVAEDPLKYDCEDRSPSRAMAAVTAGRRDKLVRPREWVLEVETESLSCEHSGGKVDEECRRILKRTTDASPECSCHYTDP